ncbi:MAG: caspase family protein [Elusimicrobia bacterium]|nr:caspase family protein [Elusimicrobiota bacterium]
MRFIALKDVYIAPLILISIYASVSAEGKNVTVTTTQVLAGSQEEVVEMIKGEFSPETYSWAHMADGSFQFEPANRYSAKAVFRFSPSGDGETEVEMSATQFNNENALRKWEEHVLARVREKLRLARVAAERTLPEAAVPGPGSSSGSEAGRVSGSRKPSFASDVERPGLSRAPRPDDFAVVVGIEKYQIVPSADYGERDATSFRDYLLGLGVPEEHIVLLTGSRATRTGLVKYVEEWLPRNASADSRVYFFFSGHGAPDPETGKAYLVPWDGDPQFLESSGYPLSKLYDGLAGLKAREVLVALDSCFSGAGGRSVLAKGIRPLVAKVRTDAPASARLSVLTASSSEEVAGSLEKKGHGLFTYYMLKGLQGEADGDKDGHVTLGELHGYLSKSVGKAARLQNREQSPQLKASDPGLRVY